MTALAPNNNKMNEARIQRLTEQAITFIKLVAETEKKELFSGNSGGKDSVVLEWLLQASGIKYTSIHANTTIDPKGTIKHIRENYPHTVIMQPKETFYQLVERKGFPSRLRRFCCEFLKEYTSIGKIMFEGVRSAESKGRQGRDYIQCDSRKTMNGAKHVYPIYDWTDNDVWDFIELHKIELAPHYKTGANRLGCVGCPLAYKKTRQKEFEMYPKVYNAIKKAIEKGMKNNPQWKLSVACNGNSDIAMQYYLSGLSIDKFFESNLFNQNHFAKTDKGWEILPNDNS